MFWLLCLAVVGRPSLADFEIATIATVLYPEGYSANPIGNQLEATYDEEDVAFMFLARSGSNAKILRLGPSMQETFMVDAPFASAKMATKFDSVVFLGAEDVQGIENLYKMFADGSVELVEEDIDCPFTFNCFRVFNDELYFVNETHLKKLSSHTSPVVDVFSHADSPGSLGNADLPGIFADGRLIVESYGKLFLFDGSILLEYDFEAIYGLPYRRVLNSGAFGWTLFQCGFPANVCITDGDQITLSNIPSGPTSCFFMNGHVICSNLEELFTKMVFNETTLTQISMAGEENTNLTFIREILSVSDVEIVFFAVDNVNVRNIWRLNTATEQYEQLTFFEDDEVTNPNDRRLLQETPEEFNQQQVVSPQVEGFVPFLVNNRTLVSISGSEFTINIRELRFLELDTLEVFEVPGISFLTDDAVLHSVSYGGNRFAIEGEFGESVFNFTTGVSLYRIGQETSNGPTVSSSFQVQASYGVIISAFFLTLAL